MNTYKKLFEGKEIKFDLSEVIKLQNKSNYRICNVNKGDFTRRIKYSTTLKNDFDDDEENEF